MEKVFLQKYTIGNIGIYHCIFAFLPRKKKVKKFYEISSDNIGPIRPEQERIDYVTKKKNDPSMWVFQGS